MDIVIDLFKKLSKIDSSYELYLVGSGTENLNYDINNIFYLGFSNIEEVFEGKSILLAPARYDALNIAILEGILSGLIPLISNKTGIKEIFTGDCSELVIDYMDSNLYVDEILKISNYSGNKISNLLQKLKLKANYYTKKNSITEYGEILIKYGK